jgi:uncharacterized protein (DUF302 family)
MNCSTGKRKGFGNRPFSQNESRDHRQKRVAGQHSLAKRTVNRERRHMLVKLSTDKSISEVAAALPVSAQANRFGVMQVHNLKETMAKKGVEFTRECLIFEVCQPQQAKEVLEQNMTISTMLPCRISVYEEGGRTILATLRPTALLEIFGEPKLKPVAQEVENTIIRIMEEAAAK